MVKKLEIVPDYRMPDEFEAKVVEELGYKATCYDGLEAELQADIFIERRPEIAKDRSKVIQRIYDLSRQAKSGKELPKVNTSYSPAVKARYGGYEWSSKPFSTRNDTFNFHALNYLKMDHLDVAICECVANNRTTDIAYGGIAAITGQSRRNMIRRIDRLVSRGLIYKTDRGNQAAVYDLSPLWAAVDKSVSEHPHSVSVSLPIVSGSHHE